LYIFVVVLVAIYVVRDIKVIVWPSDSSSGHISEDTLGGAVKARYVIKA